jgi:hypothetical protein
MTRVNVAQSIDAVERALTHFNNSLRTAGFADGASAYQQMTDVVLGQWLWVEETDQRDLEPGFLRIAKLAQSVAHQLIPYLEAMQRLTALQGLVGERWGIVSDSPGARVVGALADSVQPMSLADLHTATGLPTATLRRTLEPLVQARRIVRLGDRTPRYGLGTSRSAELYG